jgi:hypothetical protein
MTMQAALAFRAYIAATESHRINATIVTAGRGTPSRAVRLVLKAKQRAITINQVEQWLSVRLAWSVLGE